MEIKYIFQREKNVFARERERDCVFWGQRCLPEKEYVFQKENVSRAAHTRN